MRKYIEKNKVNIQNIVIITILDQAYSEKYIFKKVELYKLNNTRVSFVRKIIDEEYEKDNICAYTMHMKYIKID